MNKLLLHNTKWVWLSYTGGMVEVLAGKIYSKILTKDYNTSHDFFSPRGPWGCKTRTDPPFPHACHKRRLKWGGFSECPSKGWPHVGAWTGMLKNPIKCLWRWEPDLRSNFFFSPHAHLCAVTYCKIKNCRWDLISLFSWVNKNNENKSLTKF